MSFRAPVAPPSPVGYTPDSSSAEGFLLLTISNATITSTSPRHPIPTPLKGLLSLECITLKVADPLGRDVWLVLRVEAPSGSNQSSFELPLPATQSILLARSENQYTLPMSSAGSTGELVLKLKAPTTAAEKEDLETLEVILAQYAALQVQEPTPVAGSSSGRQVNADADGDLKGRLVLVDEDNGQVVGTLGDQFNLREDPRLRGEGNVKDPVIVEIPDEDFSAPTTPSGGPRRVVKREIFVHPINVDDSDWVGKTAGLLSRGVVLATNAITTGVTGAANYYIAHSTPNEKPIVFSENTRSNVKRIHNISGKAVKVTAKTTGLIHKTVEMLADKVAGGNKEGTSSHHGAYTPHGSARFTPQGSSSTLDSQANTRAPLTPPPPRRRLLNRLLTSTDMLLTTIESSAYHLISHTTTSASTVAHHKYGEEAGNAVGMVGESIRNVGVVYIDARGVGRRALLRTAGKSMLRARMGGKDVVFQGQGEHGVLYTGAPPSGKTSPPNDDYKPPAYPPPGMGPKPPGGYP